jgi:hypothetical protein
MSYCRWSSDDWQCDVYVYAHVDGGWATHVAGRRWIFTVELPPPTPLPRGFSHDQFTAWYQRHREVMRLHGEVDKGHWLELPEPEGGIDYMHRTAGECADNLERLRAAGFNVPQYAIDELREEES